LTVVDRVGARRLIREPLGRALEQQATICRVIWRADLMNDQHMKRMRIWQSLLFSVAPAALIYLAIWVVAPAITAGFGQPFLVAYLICWGTTEVCFFVAALVAYRAEGNPLHWRSFVERYRLGRPRKSDILWSIVALALMLITNLGLAFTAQWLASIPAFSPHKAFPPELVPNALAHLVPGVFMGMPIKGAWWVLVVYLVGWVFNILGEEWWYRGFMLPRQELAHGRLGWLVNGLSFWILHIVWKWNLVALLPGSLVLSYVAQTRKTTWVGIIAHGVLNFTPIVAITAGVMGWGVT
jgi:membrane protease YdiL (CAAX protease family)